MPGEGCCTTTHTCKCWQCMELFIYSIFTLLTFSLQHTCPYAEVLHRSQTLILTWPMPKAIFLSFFHTLLKVKINPGSMPLSGCVTNISGVYFGWDPCPIQVSWKCVLQFLCNPADNPTNQQTDRKENLLGRCNKPKCLTLCQHPESLGQVSKIYNVHQSLCVILIQPSGTNVGS